MNVCVVCQADGVLQVAAGWYCMNHLHEAVYMLFDQLKLLANLDYDDDDLQAELDTLLDDLGYVWSDGE